MSCKTCKWAKFQRTPSGRIKRNVHGTCEYPPPIEPLKPACEIYKQSGRMAIWPELYQGCPVYEPVEPKQ